MVRTSRAPNIEGPSSRAEAMTISLRGIGLPSSIAVNDGNEVGQPVVTREGRRFPYGTILAFTVPEEHEYPPVGPVVLRCKG